MRLAVLERGDSSVLSAGSRQKEQVVAVLRHCAVDALQAVSERSPRSDVQTLGTFGRFDVSKVDIELDVEVEVGR